MTMQRARRTAGFLCQVLLGLGLVVAAAAPAMATRLELPPITTPASHERHVGKVILVELATPDLAAAERFYGGLFGWTFRAANAGGTAYAEARLDGHPVAGLFQRALPPRAHRRSAWLAFFSSADVDGAAKEAAEDGGKVLFGPKSFPDRGREAVVADPEGAVFAILEASSGDPPDLLAEPGEWIWSSLITSDPDDAAGFYQKLFGYEVYPLPPGPRPEAEHLILATGGFARASVNALPANRPHAHPHWLDFVRVTDTRAMAARVEALGGRILVAPRLDRNGTWVALVADPEGAVFGLLEWPPAGPHGEPGK